MCFSDTFLKLYCVPGSVLPTFCLIPPTFDDSTDVIRWVKPVELIEYFTFLINPCNENLAQKHDE